MTPFERTLAELLPFILTGLATWLVTSLQNRNNAQKLINEQFTAVNKKLDDAQTRLDEKERAEAKQAEAFAAERGGLNERIRMLEEQRREAMQKSDNNGERIAALEAQLGTMKDEQARLQAEMKTITQQRDEAVRALAAKEHELQTIRTQFEQLQAQITELRQTIEAKDSELRLIRERLDGRKEGEPEAQ